MSNKSFSLIFLIAFLVFGALTLLYLSNNLFPSILSNQPNYELYERTLNKDYHAQILLNHWPNSFVTLILFFLAYFSLVFGLGHYRRSKMEAWSFIKKSVGTNALIFGLLALGIFFFLTLWPTDPFGTISWSLVALLIPTMISIFLLYYEPVATVTTPQQIKQVQKQKDWLVGAKTLSLAISVAVFIFSLALIIMALISPEPEMEDLSSRTFAIFFALIILVIGEPIPLVLYFYLRNKVKKQEEAIGQEVKPTTQQTAITKPSSKPYWKLILFIILVLIFVVALFMFFLKPISPTVR